jgi:DNA-binding NarL/FixJ family response regulator
MSRPKVLLAEDHSLVAHSLARLLRDDFDLVGIVGDGQSLVDAARRLTPDVIVADIQMPVMNGLEALHQLKIAGIDVRMLFLTADSDVQVAGAVMRAGAAGFVLKHTAGEELIPAIREVLQGRTYRTHHPALTTSAGERRGSWLL